MSNRLYTTRRQAIVNSLVNVLKTIDGTGAFLSNIYGNVSPRLKFWDEITDFPAIHLNAGGETREYQGGGYKDRYLTVLIRVYVNQEDAVDALDRLVEDVETVLEDNSRLTYTDKQGATQFTHQISIISINTDEGVLEPYGVAEISIQVRY